MWLKRPSRHNTSWSREGFSVGGGGGGGGTESGVRRGGTAIRSAHASVSVTPSLDVTQPHSVICLDTTTSHSVIYLVTTKSHSVILQVTLSKSQLTKSQLTLSGGPDSLHVLLQVLADVGQEVVVGVQVGDDLIPVVEVVGAVMVDIVHRGLGRRHNYMKVFIYTHVRD